MSQARHPTGHVQALPGGARLLLEVTDAGSGFDLPALPGKSNGAGLESIAYRIARIDDQLELKPQPGATRLAVCQPAEPAAKPQATKNRATLHPSPLTHSADLRLALSPRYAPM